MSARGCARGSLLPVECVCHAGRVCVRVCVMLGVGGGWWWVMRTVLRALPPLVQEAVEVLELLNHRQVEPSQYRAAHRKVGSWRESQACGHTQGCTSSTYRVHVQGQGKVIAIQPGSTGRSMCLAACGMELAGLHCVGTHRPQGPQGSHPLWRGPWS